MAVEGTLQQTFVDFNLGVRHILAAAHSASFLPAQAQSAGSQWNENIRSKNLAPDHHSHLVVELDDG